MSTFQIIALKTGKRPATKTGAEGIRLNPCKNLKENCVYTFNKNYSFPHNDFSEIHFDAVNDTDLFSIDFDGRKIPVNINAVVGANGSGKSTLVELLFWMAYNIGCSLGAFKDQKSSKKLQPYKFLDVAIFYSISQDAYRSLVIRDGEVYFQEFVKKGESIVFDSLASRSRYPNFILESRDLQDFFYTVAVNYSHYSLNSGEMGKWIQYLFHKNDGYQTPMVINPMRTDGIININTERNLLSRRLQANLLENTGSREKRKTLRTVVNDKVASFFQLKYISNSEYEQPKAPKTRDEVLEGLRKHFGLELTVEELDNFHFINVGINYLVAKLEKIAQTYRQYNRYGIWRGDEKGTRHFSGLKYINAFLKNAKDSDSHVFFKLKGIILYLKYYKIIFDVENINLKDQYNLEVDRLSEIVAEISEKEDYWVNTFMLTPPSLFRTEVILDDGTSLDALSSGEKQRIHSINSIIYHLIYLNSVGKFNQEDSEEGKLLNYRFVNIVLDEIELYYHPEWQRKYIADLLETIEKISPANMDHIEGINIIFLTHSPYILSDIPNQYILKLKDGHPVSSDDNERTFGANIHELLAHSFFMETTTGEYARQKIGEILKFYQEVREATQADMGTLQVEYKDKQSIFEYIVQNIGEDVIRGLLSNHLKFIEERLTAPNAN